MTRSVGVVTNQRQNFTRGIEVSELATEMKTYAKTYANTPQGLVRAVYRRGDGSSAYVSVGAATDQLGHRQGVRGAGGV